MAAVNRDNEEEVKTDDGSPKIKPRPIVRLGIFLIAHSPVFSVVFSAAGVLALLLLPLLAKNTYISENALMPGFVTYLRIQLKSTFGYCTC
jgi:glycosylphosphatidylinositol transamidase